MFSKLRLLEAKLPYLDFDIGVRIAKKQTQIFAQDKILKLLQCLDKQLSLEGPFLREQCL